MGGGRGVGGLVEGGWGGVRGGGVAAEMLGGYH